MSKITKKQSTPVVGEKPNGKSQSILKENMSQPRNPETSKIRSSPISTVEWDIEEAIKRIPDWQLSVMLHYEFARCSRPMLNAVRQLRAKDKTDKRIGNKSSPGEAIPQFARYLKHVFPEFPGTPWVKIHQKTIIQRLSWIGINAKNGLFLPPSPAWEAWDFFEADDLYFRNELAGLAGESYGVFKLDFSKEDKVIIKQFEDWLFQRRQTLVTRYGTVIKLSDGSTLNKSLSFKPRKPIKKADGGASKIKKCKTFLKALGRLRLWEFTEHDVEKAGAIYESNSDEFPDELLFKRAAYMTCHMMTRLEAAWNSYSFPCDVIECENLVEAFLPRELRETTKTVTDMNKHESAKTVSYLIKHFALDEMTLELMK